MPDPLPLIYIPAKLGFAAGLAYIQRGRHIVYGSQGAEAEAEARALGCRFIIRNADGQPEPL